MLKVKIFVAFLIIFQLNCTPGVAPENATGEMSESGVKEEQAEPEVGAAQLDAYLPMLAGKNVGMLVNHTSMVGDRHLVDILLEKGVKIQSIFAPEHGFRGTADAGEHITDGKDPETGIPLVSLYGKNRKPQPEQLAGLDWVIFDIQDVGTRFYTYISSMSYMMDACADLGIQMLILDRPNPNGHYVDDPLVEVGHDSYVPFVGLHPVPIVHGMTVGEYAQMVNGEGWLSEDLRCKLTVIPIENYTHQTVYELPVAPSPNLPNMRSIYLYPSLCFFEGTVASEGRGTDKQFQVYGHPDYPGGDFTFTPMPGPGSKHPKLEGQECHGYDLTGLDPMDIHDEARIHLDYFIEFYRNFPDKENLFRKNNYFDTLAGSKKLREDIEAGKSEEEIRAGWKPDLDRYREMRRKYLLYPES